MALMSEVLNGTPQGASGTWFVEGSEALKATLADLSAQEASRSFEEGINSIAAHVLHMTYYLELATDGMKQVERNGDWEESWAKQVVNDSEWEQAKLDCESRFKEFSETLSSFELSDPDDLTYAIANVGHAGYHLGAIRQLSLLVKSLK